ncbi:DNA repair protein rad5 [Colletotrichum salicis]|uniref:DNA repair protein rad5 n=1 Tax=Colletotrichum salicis TaxID=1209931 RepID=A0A135UE09_9PEZI|nr:DNA repair protein rad5 [Colletotrichum salicis]
MNAQRVNDIDQAPVTGIHLILDNEWQLVSSTRPGCRAALDPRGRELLELFHREGISIDILGLPADQEAVDDDGIQLRVTIYGPHKLAQGVGSTLQKAELYLQDPTFSLTDVEYFNPQRFTNTKGSQTIDFRPVHSDENEVSADKEEALVAIDVLKSVTSTNVRHETSGSCYFQTDLQRGGILADLMGLGKTLSMISLLAHDELRKSGPQSMRQDMDSLGSGGTLVVVPLSPHEIKDLKTAKAQAICELRGDCKWVVTGTPIQNRLSELHSLLHFLGVYPYDDKIAFDRDITNPWLRGEETGPEALRKVLSYVMLRRSQDAITLPERRDHRRHLYLSRQEQRMYDAVKTKAIEFLDNALEFSRGKDSYTTALENINALRLVCQLGCFQKLSFQQTPRKPTSSTGLLPRTPDRQSTPLTPGGETEEDDDIENGAIAEEIDNFCPPLTGLGSNWTQEPSDMLCGAMPIDQWPTKIRALLTSLVSYFRTGTSILDVAELTLNDAGIYCAKIDGKKNLRKRSRIIDDFSKAHGPSVLLLSLGCGAVGLTLTAASRAYLLEPQWKPSIEEQALARIHRIGQSQEVTTVRFAISNSIDQYVLDIQNGKRGLMSLLSSKPATSRQLTAKLQQLRQLLR